MSITVQIPKNLGSKFDKMLTQEMKTADTAISKRLVDYSKSNHRFESRTGRLESSITVKGNLKDGLEVYLDLSVAEYGKYINYGQRTWNADKFLAQALKDNQSWINKRVNTAVNNAVKRFNRS